MNVNGQSSAICIEDNFEEAVNRAALLYEKSEIFIYPTDTIYGIGGNPFSNQVVAKINEIKGREVNKQFILLINSVQALSRYVKFLSETVVKFLEMLWPAKVSVILELNPDYQNLLGISNCAFRIPDELFCLGLLNKINRPLISTSVNLSGEVPLNNPDKIKNYFSGKEKTIFYYKKSKTDAVSTLLDLTGIEPILIREGEIKFHDILNIFHQVK